jgi:iron complex outermembrane receptor protein
MNRFHYREISTWNEYQFDTFTTVATETGRLQHRLVVGVESGLSTTDSLIGVGPASPININNPVYGPHPSDPPLAPTRYNVTRVGLYALDQLRISKTITVVPGLRWSRIGIDDKVAAAAANGLQAESNENFVSPNIGVVMLPQPWFSLYFNYTQGFEPPAPGQYLQGGGAPALSENGSIEGGVKTDFFQQRLSVTGALFRLRRTNVPETDTLGFIRQIGEGTSHGFETEVVGLLAPALSVRGGYAWTETEITRDSSGFVGRELPNAPHHKFDLWMRYRFPPDVVRGVMVAAGVVHVSDRFTARNNLVVQPPYTRVDATASWDLAGPRLTLGLGVENLTNRRCHIRDQQQLHRRPATPG